jgi:DNA mismatch repair protein MLH1
VCEIRTALDAAAHPGLVELLRRHTYVGMATPSLALLQHGTKLYLASMPRLTRELFTQLALLRFGAAPQLPLTPPAPVEDLVFEACAAAAARSEGESPPAEIARMACELLLAKAPMLREYFALDIGETGGRVELRALPALCDGYAPSLLGLPEFLLRLACNTDWTAEQVCFADIARHLGALHALRPPPPGATALQDHEWGVAHVLLPALRSHLRPPAPFATDGTVLQVACLEQLYKVFERC